METVRQWPPWIKVVSLFVLVGIAQGIIGGRADAIFVWALPLLSQKFTVLGSGLLLVALMGWCLGMETFSFLHRKQIPSASDSRTAAEFNLQQPNSTTSELTPQEEAEAELAQLLREIAQGNTTSLPGILPPLRYTFDQLGRDEDAAWCQAELNGYNEDETPQYRYADVTIEWRSVRGVNSMDTMTGRIVGKPPDRIVSLPVAVPVEEIVGMRSTGRRTLTGKTQPGVMGAWNEVAEISPEAVQGVLRRIMNECYLRATGANKAIKVV